MTSPAGSSTRTTEALKQIEENLSRFPDDAWIDMTERDLKAFERTCELFEEFLKKTMPKKKRGLKPAAFE